MAMASRRVASLLPSATEILAHLSLSHMVVGVTHECDALFTVEDVADVELGAALEDGRVCVCVCSLFVLCFAFWFRNRSAASPVCTTLASYNTCHYCTRLVWRLLMGNGGI